MALRLLTELHLEVLSLKGGCTGSSESTLVKMPHCWKSHVAVHLKQVQGHTKYILISTISFYKHACRATQWD